MIKIYVQGTSKKAINERLASGQAVYGTEYNMLSTREHRLDDKLPEGTIISVFERIVAGNPYAKSYGVWQKGKVK